MPGEAGEWITIDEVDYDDAAPWPSAPDGGGPSLERIANTAYGNDPANWRASTASGGTPGESLPPTEPLIAFEPAAITASILEGTNAAPAAFEVWNVGINTLTYTLADDAAWLTLSPAGGSSPGGAVRRAHSATFGAASL